jgi:glutamate racemase
MKKTILVTDSGLGGLSVFTDIAAQLSKASPWPEVSMIYFNSWPEQNRGYNHLSDMEDRARVFHNALTAMAALEPDEILVACNTLSVIYPFTRFSRTPSIPVSGIVDHGVDMMAEALNHDPDSGVIIFGTPTTARDGSHARHLIQRGIKPERIITQACLNLAGKIERDPFAHEVEDMIRDNVIEAGQRGAGQFKRIFAALCCTHFGYCSDLFERQIKARVKDEAKSQIKHRTRDQVEILNPNKRMAQKILSSALEQANLFQADIRYKIVSRVEWEPSRIAAYERLLGDQSPEVVQALKQYEHIPDLFDV